MEETRRRFVELDVYRGIAIAMMVVFHFLYDLNLYRLTHIGLFQNPFWLVYREFLVFLFLGVVGACLFLVHGERIQWALFGKRSVRIGGAALLVTIGTYIYDHQRFIVFGILHFITTASLVALPFLKRKRLSLFAGLACLAFGFIGNLNDRIFYIPGLAWLGFGSKHIVTFDFFPFIPNFGYILLGIFLMQTVQKNRDALFFQLPDQPSARFLAFLGRHPLTIYLVHGPVLIGIASLLARR